MERQEAMSQLADIYGQMGQLRQQLREVQRAIEPQEVEDYTFGTSAGPVSLSELFGDDDTLFVIHNMGRGCSYCTLWADGFNGALNHLQDRAGFVIASPDEPSVQDAFKESRGWGFRMVSQKGTSFAEDLDYKSDAGWLPGVSVFKKEDGKILRVADTPFGPGDDYCSVWHFFDLIPEGVDGWTPKLSYEQ